MSQRKLNKMCAGMSEHIAFNDGKRQGNPGRIATRQLHMQEDKSKKRRGESCNQTVPTNIICKTIAARGTSTQKTNKGQNSTKTHAWGSLLTISLIQSLLTISPTPTSASGYSKSKRPQRRHLQQLTTIKKKRTNYLGRIHILFRPFANDEATGFPG